jgi:hypothetical protein
LGDFLGETKQGLRDYIVRLTKYVEFMKKGFPLHDDLFDFFYDALPGYEEVGKRRILLGCWVSFNDPELTKMDLAPAVEFDWHCAYGNVQAVRPGMPIFRLSAKTGDGMDEYLSLLTVRLDELRTPAAS